MNEAKLSTYLYLRLWFWCARCSNWLGDLSLLLLSKWKQYSVMACRRSSQEASRWKTLESKTLLIKVPFGIPTEEKYLYFREDILFGFCLLILTLATLNGHQVHSSQNPWYSLLRLEFSSRRLFGVNYCHLRFGAVSRVKSISALWLHTSSLDDETFGRLFPRVSPREWMRSTYHRNGMQHELNQLHCM